MTAAARDSAAGAPRRAVVLLSGGLDSATCLAIAREAGHVCYCLSFDYGQRHRVELRSAERLAGALGAAEHRVIPLDMAGIGGSALTDPSLAVPERGPEREAEEETEGIPLTYVPARNTVFLAYALAWAEVLEAEAIFIGVNALDYSGYPDCRPEFINAFQRMAYLATRMGVEERKPRIEAPLLELSKADIIRRGAALGVDYGLTVSCYQADPEGRACGRCDSCRFRRRGFEQAGVVDPTRYA